METEQGKSEKPFSDTQLKCILASLADAQQTIRSYDLKAQIMSVGFIFSVAMINPFLQNLEVEREFGLGYLIVGFIVLMGPVVLYGSVLYPSRWTAPKTIPNPPDVRHCYYFRSNSGRDLDAYIQDIDAADWKSELVYEIIRLSALRDLKRRRFLTALIASGVSIGTIWVSNILKLSGLT